jgi:CheY-like chemotaxis protein
MARILVADDQPDVLEALRLLLKPEGFDLETASSPAGVLQAIEARDYDVLLLDLNYARDTTSGQEGLDLLQRIQALDSTSRGHDCVGQCRSCCRSNAPRRS